MPKENQDKAEQYLAWIEEVVDGGLDGAWPAHESVEAIKRKLMERGAKSECLAKIEGAVNSCLRGKLLIGACLHQIKRLLVAPEQNRMFKVATAQIRTKHREVPRHAQVRKELPPLPTKKPTKALQRKVLKQLLREGRIFKETALREIKLTKERGGHSLIAINALAYPRRPIPGHHGDPFKFFWQGGLPQ